LRRRPPLCLEGRWRRGFAVIKSRLGAFPLETCKIRSIRAGTLERLVETLLTAFGDNDLTYTSIFLSTYRAFASTQTVLKLLLDRYRPDNFYVEENDQEVINYTRLSLCTDSALASILRAWLDQCPEDFQEPPDYPCLHRLMEYLRKALPGSEALRRAEGLLEQLQGQANMDETDGIETYLFWIF
uniref:N-terminal Ras-GEF domain-containing protein n=1 Tax=Poecilia latipinna TaxID=48699 RepID=A0A3B3TMD4_9TELE